MDLHHTGSNEENLVVVPEEQEEQLEVPKAAEGDVEELQ
jgi:hypothetical protein